MDGSLLKICAVAILCAGMGLLFKQIRGDFSALLRVAGLAIMFGFLIPVVGRVANETISLFEGDGIAPYAETMLRALGIALLTRICADICRDCGETGAASGVEMAGKLTILLLCVPLIREMIGYATEILQME